MSFISERRVSAPPMAGALRFLLFRVLHEPDAISARLLASVQQDLIYENPLPYLHPLGNHFLLVPLLLLSFPPNCCRARLAASNSRCLLGAFRVTGILFQLLL